MTVYYKPVGGGTISESIDRAIKMAALAQDEVELNFNDTTVTVQADHRGQVYAEWSNKRHGR